MSSALLIVERNEQILSLLYQENRLVQVRVHEEKQNTKLSAKEGEDEKSPLPLDAIYIGKVKNVVPTIDAAFVEVTKGTMGFLPMKQAKNPIIINRKYNGKIVAGDEILVQVEKEPIKTKDVGLTCNLSFSGKYCVLTTGKQGIGLSTKLDNKTKVFWKQKLEEWKLKEVLQEENVGMVVRTNAAELMEKDDLSKSERVSELPGKYSSAHKSELSEYKFVGQSKTDAVLDKMEPVETERFREEFFCLLALKNKVLKNVSYRTCFSCLFQPMESYLTDLRDTYEELFDKVITDQRDIYERIREEFPHLKKVEFYEDSRISLEKLYSVETRLQEALAEKVWLKSGAYLIIQQTEALTVIDVNSGKIQKKNPKDDIYFEINQEAAKEIALQLKLRNLSGIIIIDFISQNTKEQDNELLSYLSSLVRKDSIKTHVIDMTPLGLVEVTRKKIHKSLKEQLQNQYDNRR